MEEKPRKTRTRLAPDVRRASVLDAAERVILEQGLAATTMDDVARAADVAKGTVYLYFDSKDDLVYALRAQYAESLIATAGSLLAVGGRGSRARRLDAFVSGMAAAYGQSHRLYHVLFQEASASELPIMEPLRVLMLRFVDAGVEAGDFAVPDPALATEFLVQGIHAGLSAAVHRPEPARAVASVQLLSRRILGV